MTTVASRWAFNLATVGVLWRRDVVRFFRQKSRVLGALAQPVLFWWVIGGGFAGTFALPGAQGVSYQQYFFPGVVTMVVLFSAIFATITVIEDKQQGFLQAVLAGPGSRIALARGKMCGSSTVALLQAGVFLLLAPLAGVSYASVNWPWLLGVLLLTAFALTGLGVALAWWVNSAPAYHAVMSMVLIPMWVLSGAMFPVQGASAGLARVMAANPLRFSVEAVRRGLYGNDFAAVSVAASTAATEALALLVFALSMVAVAAWRISRKA
jgi:ABC-2 type transport system permease protein